jgi:IMP dehydrogenase
MSITTALSYDDVLLVPKYSSIISRNTDILISQTLDKVGKFSFPVISSPMDTITEWKMFREISKFGGSGIIHRYNTIEQQAEEVALAYASTSPRGPGAAIGVSGDYLERAEECLNCGASFLCIDVAHGHHILVKQALENLRNVYGNDIHIMAGNVATLEGLNDLADWGANSVRVGIGGGSICSTRIQTGHGVPTLHSLMECSKTDRDVSIIADGGIRNSGDIVKALAAGADFVMIGSLLSGTEETPGEIINFYDKKKKIYRGMASVEAQIDWRGKTSSIEGITHYVPYKGRVTEILKNLKVGIHSGLSYSGAKSINELQSNSTFIRQTISGQHESNTHIKMS